MLTYSIVPQCLFGDVGGKRFDVLAVSGGARGSRKGLAQNTFDSWDFNRKENKSRLIRGGPIPPGFYMVQKPSHHHVLGRAAFLQQTVTSLLQPDKSAPIGFKVTDRDGFYIHGPGPKGSDECIVPMTQFKELMDMLSKEAPLALRVIEPGRPWTDFDEQASRDRVRTA